MLDFTLEQYAELLKQIKSSGFKTYSIYDWLVQKPNSGVVLRHDVDRKAHNSLLCARIEAEHGIRSTYNFRITKGSFIPKIIEEVRDLGHEIGYHYEDLSLANGDMNKAEQLFMKHLARLRQYAEVKTITMHGRPLSKYDNRDLWKLMNYEKYDLVGEAFLSIDYDQMYYFTDTGRSWSSKSNMRDKVSSKMAAARKVESTPDLIEFIKGMKPDDKLALVTHPERWARSIPDWISQYSKDLMINIVKKVISLTR